jgi:nicotinate-nucleotide adenylyltransferase
MYNNERTHDIMKTEQEIKRHKVAIFGGSFNPVHLGHVALAQNIQGLYSFDRLLIVPSNNPPHKPKYEISPEHRLAMVSLAFSGLPGAEISRIELDRAEVSYAITTIAEVKSKYLDSDVYFVTGADAFAEINRWHKFAEVIESCSFVVATRAGMSEQQDKKLWDLIAEFHSTGLLTRVQSDDTRILEFKTRSGSRIAVSNVTAPPISSTEVRARIKAGRPVKDLVGLGVAEYLLRHNLYLD